MSKHNPELLTEHFIAEGMAAIESFIDEIPTEQNQRLDMLESIRKAIDGIYIENKMLDRMHEAYEACISEALRVAEGDKSIIQYANVTSYNLAANLADCWPDAKQARSDKHFTAGVNAANRCVALRKQLDKPPHAFAMAYFVLGVHEYSLKHYAKAQKAWLKKLENETIQLNDTAHAQTDLNMCLSRGLIGLAGWSLGTENNSNYEQSILDLQTLRTTENENEVDLFVNELTLLKQKHSPFAIADETTQ